MTIKPEHGILRNNTDDGWYVLPIKRGTSPKPFFDAAFKNDPVLSYKAAKHFNAGLRPYVKPIKNYSKTKSNKINKELPVGISLASSYRLNPGGKGKTLVYNFKVSLLSGKPTTVYIGTEATWLSNYDAALKKAINKREASKDELYKPDDLF